MIGYSRGIRGLHYKYRSYSLLLDGGRRSVRYAGDMAISGGSQGLDMAKEARERAALAKQKTAPSETVDASGLAHKEIQATITKGDLMGAGGVAEGKGIGLPQLKFKTPQDAEKFMKAGNDASLRISLDTTPGPNVLSMGFGFVMACVGSAMGGTGMGDLVGSYSDDAKKLRDMVGKFGYDGLKMPLFGCGMVYGQEMTVSVMDDTSNVAKVDAPTVKIVDPLGNWKPIEIPKPEKPEDLEKLGLVEIRPGIWSPADAESTPPKELLDLAMTTSPSTGNLKLGDSQSSWLGFSMAVGGTVVATRGKDYDGDGTAKLDPGKSVDSQISRNDPLVIAFNKNAEGGGLSAASGNIYVPTSPKVLNDGLKLYNPSSGVSTSSIVDGKPFYVKITPDMVKPDLVTIKEKGVVAHQYYIATVKIDGQDKKMQITPEQFKQLQEKEPNGVYLGLAKSTQGTGLTGTLFSVKDDGATFTVKASREDLDLTRDLTKHKPGDPLEHSEAFDFNDANFTVTTTSEQPRPANLKDTLDSFTAFVDSTNGCFSDKDINTAIGTAQKGLTQLTAMKEQIENLPGPEKAAALKKIEAMETKLNVLLSDGPGSLKEKLAMTPTERVVSSLPGRAEMVSGYTSQNRQDFCAITGAKPIPKAPPGESQKYECLSPEASSAFMSKIISSEALPSILVANGLAKNQEEAKALIATMNNNNPTLEGKIKYLQGLATDGKARPAFLDGKIGPETLFKFVQSAVKAANNATTSKECTDLKNLINDLVPNHGKVKNDSFGIDALETHLDSRAKFLDALPATADAALKFAGPPVDFHGTKENSATIAANINSTIDAIKKNVPGCSGLPNPPAELTPDALQTIKALNPELAGQIEKLYKASVAFTPETGTIANQIATNTQDFATKIATAVETVELPTDINKLQATIEASDLPNKQELLDNLHKRANTMSTGLVSEVATMKTETRTQMDALIQLNKAFPTEESRKSKEYTDGLKTIQSNVDMLATKGQELDARLKAVQGITPDVDNKELLVALQTEIKKTSDGTTTGGGLLEEVKDLQSALTGTSAPMVNELSTINKDITAAIGGVDVALKTTTATSQVETIASKNNVQLTPPEKLVMSKFLAAMESPYTTQEGMNTAADRLFTPLLAKRDDGSYKSAMTQVLMDLYGIAAEALAKAHELSGTSGSTQKEYLTEFQGRIQAFAGIGDSFGDVAKLVGDVKAQKNKVEAYTIKHMLKNDLPGAEAELKKFIGKAEGNSITGGGSHSITVKNDQIMLDNKPFTMATATEEEKALLVGIVDSYAKNIAYSTATVGESGVDYKMDQGTEEVATPVISTGKQAEVVAEDTQAKLPVVATIDGKINFGGKPLEDKYGQTLSDDGADGPPTIKRLENGDFEISSGSSKMVVDQNTKLLKTLNGKESDAPKVSFSAGVSLSGDEAPKTKALPEQMAKEVLKKALTGSDFGNIVGPGSIVALLNSSPNSKYLDDVVKAFNDANSGYTMERKGNQISIKNS